MSSEILKDRTQEGKVGKEKKERKKDRSIKSARTSVTKTRAFSHSHTL